MPETWEMVPEGWGLDNTALEHTGKTGPGPAEGLSLWNYQKKKNFKIGIHAVNVKTTIFPREVNSKIINFHKALELSNRRKI